MSEAELQQIFDTFQENGALGGERLQLCIELGGVRCAKPPSQRVNKTQFVQLMTKLQALQPTMQKKYR